MELALKSYIEERVLEIAHYLLHTKCTVRQVASVFCVSKSTAHKDLSWRLALIDEKLYREVTKVLGENWAQRYIRGGESTKRKYKGK